MSNFLVHFDELCARDPDSRREGVKHLTDFLQSDSAQSTAYRNMTSSEYSLQRLVRGLSAYHSPTLHGYTTSLACVLDSTHTTRPHEVFALIEKLLVTPPDAKSSEAKGYRVGQLLAVSAITHSVSFSATDTSLKSQILTLLLSLYSKELYLKTACTQVISDLISSLTQLELKAVLPQVIAELGSSAILECSPEKLAILLSACRHYSSSKLSRKLVKSCLQIPGLDSPDQLAAITDVALRSVTGSYLHPCVSLCVEYYLTTDLFHAFWQSLVEEGIFEMELSRKCAAFDVFYHTIQCDPAITHMFSCLSPSLTQLFKSALHTDREPLHTRCVSTLKQLSSLMQSRRVSPVVILLLDLCLFTPLKQQLTETADVSARQEDTCVLIQSLFEHFLRGTVLIHYPPFFSRLSDLSAPLPASRDYTLSLVLYLCKQRGDYMTSQTEESVLKFLSTHSYFTLHRSSKAFYPCKLDTGVELCQEVRERCREVLFLLLTELLTQETRRLAYFSQLGFAVKWTLSLLDKPDYVTLCSSTDTDTVQMLRGVLPLTVELERELGAGEVGRQRSNLLTLIHYYCLLLLNEPNPITATCASNLIHCYNTDSECSSSLMEVILSALSHSTHLSRTLATSLFRAVLPLLTRDALLILTDAAFDTDQTMDEDSDSEQESESVSEDSVHTESATSSESECDNEDSVEMKDLLFKKNVLEALGDAGMDQGSSDESLDMDADEERLKGVDIALSQLFRQKLKTENPKRIEKERNISTLHYRIRVLSLVQMFIEKQNDNPLLIYLVVPASESLLASAKDDKLKEFHSKLVSLFSKKLCTSKCKLDASAEFMCVVFNREFHLAVSAHSLELSKLLSGGVATVLKAMRRADMLEECSDKLTDAVLECLDHLAEKKHGYQWNVPFIKLIEFSPLVACSLIPPLIQAITASSYRFQTRKCEDILQSILLSSHSTDHLQPYMQQLHTFYTDRLSMVPSIENANHCHAVLSLALPYCQLVARSVSAESYQEETEQLIDKLSDTDKVSKSQRLSRVCVSLSNALCGSVGRSRRKRSRSARGRGVVKRKV